MSAVLKQAMRRAWPRQKLPGAIYHDFVRDEHAVDGVRKALDEIWTFERDSIVNGWERENRANLLTSFAVDEPAFVIDPATGQRLGYRALAGFTNSLLWSRDLSNGPWSKNLSPTLSQDAVGLKGVANTAWTIEDESDSEGRYVYQDVTVPDDGATITCVAYFEKNSGDEANGFPAFRCHLRGGSTEVDHAASIDTRDGSNQGVTGRSEGTQNVRDAGEYWEVVVSVTNNSTGNTTLRFNVYPALTETLGGSASSSPTGSIVYDFGGVYLNSSIAGPPIETEGSPVSTAADDASEPLPAICQDGFVWVVHARTASSISSDRQFIGQIDDGTNNNRVIFRRETNRQIRLVVVAAGSTGAVIDAGEAADDTDIKVSMRAEGGRWALCLNGAAVVTDSDAAFPSGLNRKQIGQSGGDQWNSTIALDYLDPDPSAWSDADLQEVTS